MCTDLVLGSWKPWAVDADLWIIPGIIFGGKAVAIGICGTYLDSGRPPNSLGMME